MIGIGLLLISGRLHANDLLPLAMLLSNTYGRFQALSSLIQRHSYRSKNTQLKAVGSGLETLASPAVRSQAGRNSTCIWFCLLEPCVPAQRMTWDSPCEYSMLLPGLVAVMLLLGFGLVRIPRSMLQEADPASRLAYAHHK